MMVLVGVLLVVGDKSAMSVGFRVLPLLRVGTVAVNPR
jgi:hypothetical protein